MGRHGPDASSRAGLACQFRFAVLAGLPYDHGCKVSTQERPKQIGAVSNAARLFQTVKDRAVR